MDSLFKSFLLFTAIIAVLRLSHCHLGLNTSSHSFRIYLLCFSPSWKHSRGDNHMLVASSVCKWYPTQMVLVILIKAPINSHMLCHYMHPAKLEINMIPLLSTHRSLCYALLALSTSIQIAAVKWVISSGNWVLLTNWNSAIIVQTNVSNTCWHWRRLHENMDY